MQIRASERHWPVIVRARRSETLKRSMRATAPLGGHFDFELAQALSLVELHASVLDPPAVHVLSAISRWRTTSKMSLPRSAG